MAESKYRHACDAQRVGPDFLFAVFAYNGIADGVSLIDTDTVIVVEVSGKVSEARHRLHLYGYVFGIEALVLQVGGIAQSAVLEVGEGVEGKRRLQ